MDVSCAVAAHRTHGRGGISLVDLLCVEFKPDRVVVQNLGSYHAFVTRMCAWNAVPLC